MTSTANSGVASRLPLLLGEQLLAVVLGRSTARRVRTEPQHRGSSSGSTSASSWQRDLPRRCRAGTRRTRTSIHSNRSIERDAGEDEDGPQHERAEDAPEQHAELVLRRARRRTEDHRPHEHVVDREALLDQVAGEYSPAAWPPCHRSTTRPNARPIAIHTALSIAASLIGDDVRLAVEHEQVDEQQRGDEREEARPTATAATSKSAKLVAVARRRGASAAARASRSAVAAPSTAWAAASRAIGTRNGEHDT